jgi:hypothetical protein
MCLLSETGMASSPLRRMCARGGDGVDMGADEGAVVLEETEDTLSDLEGVGTAEMREPRERSGVPKD